MNFDHGGEFLEICKVIIDENKTQEKWSLIEADDFFQTDHFCGGFDATENAFCFSYYDNKNVEYWLQLDMENVKEFFTKKDLNLLKFRIPEE